MIKSGDESFARMVGGAGFLLSQEWHFRDASFQFLTRHSCESRNPEQQND